MQYDVFISYSSKDSATAQAICHELEDNHIRCWMAPRDIPTGSKYATVITEAIISSKAVVLVFSKRSAISPWVESEINIAFSNRKPIIPYKIDKAHIEDYSEFYLMLNNRHWIEAYPDFKTRFTELIGVVYNIINPHKTHKNSVFEINEKEGVNKKMHSGGSSTPIGKRPENGGSTLKKFFLPIVACYMVAALAIVFWFKAQTPTRSISSHVVSTSTQTGSSSIPTTDKKSITFNLSPSNALIRFGDKTYKSGQPLTFMMGSTYSGIVEANGYQSQTCRFTVDQSTASSMNITLQKIPSQSSSNSSIPTTGKINGHEWVDLGLSVKWATCNVGASSPSDYGSYYAWGETNTKSEYDKDSYKYYENDAYIYIGDNISGTQYDAARVNWGGTWRLPTSDEFQMLIDRCTWIWTSQNGHNGYKVTGKNGNSIFLPAAGCYLNAGVCYRGSEGYYWSATHDSSSEGLKYSASYLNFLDGSRKTYVTHRIIGRSIRPVADK